MFLSNKSQEFKQFNWYRKNRLEKPQRGNNIHPYIHSFVPSESQWGLEDVGLDEKWLELSGEV